MLVGRGVERRRIDDLLIAARRGRSGIALVRGDPGIGKTALLDAVVADADGMTVLHARGVESEAELAFAGLTELLAPATGAIDALPEHQADALRSALALNAEPANPLVVRVALRALLADLADDQPVLLALDDVQWLDTSTVTALAFAARRLTAERVAVVVTVRDAVPVAIAAAEPEVIDLDGLEPDDARDLLTRTASLTDDVAEDVVRAAAGNPLALLELPALRLEGPPAGIEPLPVGPRVDQAFRARLDALDPDARLAVAVVAAAEDAPRSEVVDALGRLGCPATALTAVEDAGLAVSAEGRVDVRHPLLRAVAYHALTPGDRRRVHAVLAVVADADQQAERATWHRAAAADGADEAVAIELEALAHAGERRGALSTKARCYARAASLSARVDDRARRLLESADAWLAAGQWRAALDQLDAARAVATDPGLLADIAASTGQLEAYRAGPDRGIRILVDAADAIERTDPARATRLLTYAVNESVFAADGPQATALADRAVACGNAAGGLSVVSGLMARVEAGLLTGDPDVRGTAAPLAALADSLIDSDLPDAEHVFSLVALADFVFESWERAERLADVLISRGETTGREFLFGFAVPLRAELLFRQGRWAEAFATADGPLWDTPLGLPGHQAWLDAVRSRIEAGMGIDEDAARHGESARAAAALSGMRAVGAWASASLGFLELGRGRPDAARAHLEDVADTMDAGEVGEPGILWWAADHIEALWRLGDLGAARRRHDDLRAQAERTERRWARAVAARCAGLLAPTADDAEAAFAEALVWHRSLPAPFERARTLLCLGERRISGGSGDAEEPLRLALGTFEALGAQPWASRALAVLGERRTAPLPVELTKQERQVATVVGAGATNREAAETLYVSPRTIDFHLRNIYKKLGVRSRTELARVLAGGAAGDRRRRTDHSPT